MLDALIEGVESLRLPCSWVLLVPGIALVVFGRRRTPSVVAVFVVTVSVVAWLRFAGWWFAVPHGVSQIALGVAIVAATGIAWREDRRSSDWLVAVTIGLAAASTWIPCVGPELGEILNGSRTNPYQHIGGTAAFFVGQLLPFIVIAAIGVLVPNFPKRVDQRRVVAAGAVLLSVVGLLFITTLFDDIASELARRSAF